MDKKLKVLMISDHIFSTSGCGHQTRLVAEALLKSGKFQIRQLGGAIKHNDYNPLKTQEYGDDLIIWPVDGYANVDIVRSIIRSERPDFLYYMSDPRFFTWLHDIECEIRPLMPMIWYTIWDNFPVPRFNIPYYKSNDYLVTISKTTHEIIENLVPEVSRVYIPHAVNSEIFKPVPEDMIRQFRQETFKSGGNYLGDDRVIFFFNGRNARRKQTGSMVWWFKDFVDIVGHDKASLLIHSDPKDPNGQDLEAIVQELGLVHGEVLFSREKINQEGLSLIYNMVDCTLLISDAEGFGIPVLESLNCSTPVICTYTGGMKDQITDGVEEFGVAIKPASQAVIGSQDIPYIYEDRISKDDFINALLKIYSMSRKERKELGSKGREFVLKNFNFDKFNSSWVDLMLKIYEECGSWETRKGYSSFEVKRF